MVCTMDIHGLSTRPTDATVSTPTQIKVSYLDAANNTHTYRLDEGDSNKLLSTLSQTILTLAKDALSKQETAVISVSREEGSTQALIRVIQGENIRTLSATVKITDTALEALKESPGEKAAKSPIIPTLRASSRHTASVAKQTFQSISQNSRFSMEITLSDLPPPPPPEETEEPGLPPPPPPPEETEEPGLSPPPPPPGNPDEDVEERTSAIQSLKPPPPPPDETEEVPSSPPPTTLLDSVVNAEGTIITKYEGGGQQTVKEIATIASNRVFLQNMIDHLQKKHVGSPPINIQKQIDHYQKQLTAMDDPANALLQEGWVHSNYTRDVFNQASSFEEGVQKYVSAPVNMRYVEASGTENSYGFVRAGVISDMRNGWISLNELSPPFPNTPPPPPPLETADDLGSEKEITSLISSLHAAIQDPALTTDTGLIEAYHTLTSTVSNTPIDVLVAIQDKLQKAMENSSSETLSHAKQALDQLLAPYYAPKPTNNFFSPDQVIQENLKDAEDRIHTTLDKQFRSPSLQKKLQKLNGLLEQLKIDNPIWNAENTVDTMRNLLEKEIKGKQFSAVGVAAENLIKEFFKTEKPFQSATYGLKQIQKAKQDPIALQDLVAERTQLLEQQMIQLLHTQVLSDPDRIEKLLQDGKPLDLVHIGLLNPQKKELDKSGWMHDEGVEIEDMRAIFQRCNGKTLVFDGTGPMIDGDKVHLPLKFKSQNTLPLRAAVFNISPQGYVENTGLQKEANQEAIATLKESKDMMLALSKDSLFARLQAPEKNAKGYPMAIELFQTLLQAKGSLFVSLGCLSAKDRTGLVADAAVIRSVVPEKAQQKAIEQINTPKSAAMQVAQKNTIGTLHSLKINPFSNLKMFSSAFGAAVQIARNMALDWIIRRPSLQQLQSLASRTIRRFSQPPPRLLTPSPKKRRKTT